MRKDLNLKLSWYSPENWDKIIEDGYLPVLAIRDPEVFQGTAIHFPKIAPRSKKSSSSEFLKYLDEKVVLWKVLNSFDILTHLACSQGIVLLTDTEDDQFRGVLGKFLGRCLDNEPSEYVY